MSMSSSMSRPEPAMDRTIRQLLDQQADIQARLTALLPARYTLNAPLELTMLRHKLHLLESLVERHDLTTRVPVLSEAEEARALQYRCECLEVTCLQENLDVAEALRRSTPDQAPLGHGPWLDKHLGYCDPVIRNWLLRDDISPRDTLQSSFKCPHEQCLHYIYGFSTQSERDGHVKLHEPSPKTNKTTPNNLNPRDGVDMVPPYPEQLPYGHTAAALPKPLPPVQPQRPAVFKNLQPPLNLSIPSKESSHLPKTFTPTERRHSLVRSVAESDLDQQLPPLKRSRVEASLPDHAGSSRTISARDCCLYCRVFRKQCDPNRTCWSCSGELIASDVPRHWRIIGCHRGSIQSFVDLLLPGPLSPRQTQTPVTSPHVQRQNVNEYILRAFPFLVAHGATHEPVCDFPDRFWWSEDFGPRHPSGHGLAQNEGPSSHLPPILLALSSSLNYRTSSYNLLDILAISGRLSPSRHSEQVTYPVLYHAKLLLREVAFYDILQPVPAIHLELNTPRPSPPGEASMADQNRLLQECTMHFLRAFESVTFSNSRFNLHEWLATFLALCIFSVIRTLFIDFASMSPLAQSLSSFQTPGAQTNPYEAIHSVYYVLVQLFEAAAGPLTDDIDPKDPSPEENPLISHLNRIIRRESWPSLEISSRIDFLLKLGSGEKDNNGASHTFFRSTRQDQANEEVVLLPPILKQGHATRRSVPNIGALLDVGRSRPEHTMNGIMPPRKGSIQLASLHEEPETRARRHTVGEGIPIAPNPSNTLSSPISPSRSKPWFQRTQLRRAYCPKCNENPEGFRGEHELRRHIDAKHASLIKRWVCSEPAHRSASSPQPTIPLQKCKACVGRKRYGAYYNAAAHLRRAHFNPHKGGKASGDWPSMHVLKDWMTEVRHVANGNEPELSSDGEDAEPSSATEYYAPDPTFSPMVPPVRIPRANVLPATEPSWPGGGVPSPSNRAVDGPVRENRSRCPHPECGRVFKDLNAHMLTHQEERPEKCPIETCEYHTKGFARKYDKNRHALTHYKGTMICPFCPGPGTAYEKAFNRADVFKRHLSAVHNVDQTAPNSRRVINSSKGTGTGAKCTICQYEFATAQDFYEHLDDCVLNVIVPTTAPSSASTATANSNLKQRERGSIEEDSPIKSEAKPSEASREEDEEAVVVVEREEAVELQDEKMVVESP